MSFITGKHIPRRTFLRGVGATVALPFLDAMVPAGRVFAKTRAADRTRLICIEEVHGLAGCNNWAATQVPVCAAADRSQLHARARQPAQHARGAPRLHDDHQQHRLSQRRSVRAARDRR